MKGNQMRKQNFYVLNIDFKFLLSFLSKIYFHQFFHDDYRKINALIETK